MTTNCTITVDTNNVNLVGKVADFTLALVFTNWNVLSPTFCSCFDWGGFTPEFTVTGRYEFACTMIGDGKIRIKQTYPTVYPWVQNPVGGAVNANSDLRTSAPTLQTSATPGATNMVQIGQPSDRPQMLRMHVSGGVATNRVYFLVCRTTVFSLTISSVLKDAFLGETGTLLGSPGYAYIPENLSTAAEEDRIGVYAEAGVVNFHVTRLHRRDANELEIKAYAAGWRP
jgi:hypothetical protein